MNPRLRNLVIVVTAVIIATGLVLFFASFFIGKREASWGIAAGSLIALAEFDSTALVLSTLLSSKSKMFWGLLLVSKSLVILSIVGVLILVLKISGIGFIIGFSGLIFGLLTAGIYSMAGIKGGG